WSKQTELIPSVPQAFAEEMRVSGASEAGVSVVPLTFVHTASACWMVCSISFNLPAGVWSCVRMVVGLLPSTVLQRKDRLPTPVNWCAWTGQAEPPEKLTGWRTSGTISLKAYPWAATTDQSP